MELSIELRKPYKIWAPSTESHLSKLKRERSQGQKRKLLTTVHKCERNAPVVQGLSHA